MSTQPNDPERTGRLYLWANALSECHSLLRLAKRAERSVKRHVEDAAERKAKGLSPDLGNFGTPEFGGYVDLFCTMQSCRMLAVVVFCQLLNEGYSDPGKASRNSEAFRETPWDECCKDVFQTLVERAKFDALVVQLRDRRNGMIAHADAKLFEINHGQPMSSLKMISTAIEGIDFDYWESVIDPLFRSVVRASA